MYRRQFLSLAVLAALGRRDAWAATPDSAASGSDDLEALVLGTVQDAGLPQTACYTERCLAARSYAEPRFVASLALVERAQERFYLVDATPDITRQLDLIDHPAFRHRGDRRDPFDGIFLTHAHIGHYLGLALLGNEGVGIRDTPVYCTEAMGDFLAGNAPWSLMVDQGRIVPTPLALDRWHEIDELLSVRLLKVPHRDEFADTVGFVFRGPDSSLLYIPDIDSWDRWNRDLEEIVTAVDVALLDGSFFSLEEVPGRTLEEIPHPLVPHTMDLLQGVVDRGATWVLFTHLNRTNPALDEGSAQRGAVRRRRFEIAREGMRFPL